MIRFLEVSAEVPTGLVELRKGAMRRYMILRGRDTGVSKFVYWAKVDNGWSPTLVAPEPGTRARRWDRLYLNAAPS